MLRPYLRVLKVPGAAAPFLSSFLGSLAISMHSLAVLLLAREATGSFGRAGAIAAALSIGGAVGLVLQGRLVDQFGPTLVLAPAGLICAASLLLLTGMATAGASSVAMGVAAATAGVSIPAVPSAMRVLWADLVPEGEAVTPAYALHAVQHQTSTILGPLIVSTALLLAGPAAAVLGTAVLAGGAALGFAATGSSRSWRPTRAARGWRLRSLAQRGLRTLLVGCLGLGAVGGIVSVSVSAVAVEHGDPALAGVMLAGYSIGAIAGGLVYGSRPWRWPMYTHLVFAQVGEAVIFAALGLATASLVFAHPLAIAPLLVGAGIVGAPTMIVTSALLDKVVPPDSLTESYTALIAAVLLGMAGGSYVAGSVSELVGTNAIFSAATLIFALVALWVWTRRHTLEPQPATAW